MENINEHDHTKKMIDILRGGYKETNLITENDEHEADTINPQPNDVVYQDELKNIQQIVDRSGRITSFKIYPLDENVIIDGTFLPGETEGSGIKFRMSLKKGDIETSMNNIELSDKVSELLTKLKGYYQKWCDDWYEKLPTEYRPKKD